MEGGIEGGRDVCGADAGAGAVCMCMLASAAVSCVANSAVYFFSLGMCMCT